VNDEAFEVFRDRDLAQWLVGFTSKAKSRIFGLRALPAAAAFIHSSVT
jgi:hypothetical protein